MPRILIAGESWLSQATHIKGWDHFVSATYHTGHSAFREALEAAGHEVVHLPAEVAGSEFPLSADVLSTFAVVVLSDIGANTLLLHPDTWLHGKQTPNRHKLIRKFVEQGGGLLMAGGYLSYQGIDGRARYRGTPIEDVLPVKIQPFDDRIEEPEGLNPQATQPDHPLVRDVHGTWPPLLGLNEVVVKDGATLVAQAEGYPLLVAGTYGEGRAVAWTSDIGPHWCPDKFVTWRGYQTLWRNVIAWLTEKAGS